MTEKVTVKFNCSNCGAALSWHDNAADDQVVRCPACGMEAGTLGEMKAAAFAKLRAEASAMIKNLIKRQ